MGWDLGYATRLLACLFHVIISLIDPYLCNDIYVLCIAKRRYAMTSIQSNNSVQGGIYYSANNPQKHFSKGAANNAFSR